MFACGICPVTFQTIDHMRIWAAITGIALAVAALLQLWMSGTASHTLALLAGVIGGFELAMFFFDFLRGRRNG